MTGGFVGDGRCFGIRRFVIWLRANSLVAWMCWLDGFGDGCLCLVFSVGDLFYRLVAMWVWWIGYVTSWFCWLLGVVRLVGALCYRGVWRIVGGVWFGYCLDFVVIVLVLLVDW